MLHYAALTTIPWKGKRHYSFIHPAIVCHILCFATLVSCFISQFIEYVSWYCLLAFSRHRDCIKSDPSVQSLDLKWAKRPVCDVCRRQQHWSLRQHPKRASTATCESSVLVAKSCIFNLLAKKLEQWQTDSENESPVKGAISQQYSVKRELLKNTTLMFPSKRARARETCFAHLRFFRHVILCC